jgi:hypothetical protein
MSANSDRSGYFGAYNRDMMDLRLRLPRATVAALWGAAYFAPGENTAQMMARSLIEEGLARAASAGGRNVQALVQVGAELV